MKTRHIHIGIDVDGVLRDFDTQFLKYAREIKNMHITVTGQESWGFPTILDEYGDKLITHVFRYPHVGQYVYERAPMIENAYTGYQLFTDNPLIHTYIVTSQKKGYEPFTDQWLENNNLNRHIYTFYEQKKLNAPVQILIDDKPSNVTDYLDSNRFAVLINRMHNEDFDRPDVPRADDLIDAYKLITHKYL